MTDLIVFDFDYSLLEQSNTDYVIFEHFAPDISAKLGDLWREHKDTKGWTKLMDELVGELHSRGVTREQLTDFFENLQITPSMAAAVRLAAGKRCDMRILSDANTFYIDAILKGSRLKKYFKEIRTNPAVFDAEGRLHISPYEPVPPTCPFGCPINLCKGKEMDDIIAEGTPFGRIMYLGDGSGDFCACTRLRRNVIPRIEYSSDYAFVRRENPLEQLVKQNPEAVKAHVVTWETGNDVLRFFKILLATSASQR